MKTLRQSLIISLSVWSIFLPPGVDAKVIEECVYIVPAGEVNKKVLEKLKEKLPGIFPMSVKTVIEAPKDIPPDAYDPSRRQYNAQAVIDGLSERINLAIVNERAIVVTDVDLFSPGVDFVFGLADSKKGICIISLNRLRNDRQNLSADDKLLPERALKEAAHELAHSWNLQHCPSPKCVMAFSDSLQGTDKKRGEFCYKCRIALENRSGSRGLIGSKLK